MVGFDLWQLGRPDRQIDGTILADTDDGPDPALLANLARQSEANYLVIQDCECEWDEEDTDKIGLPRINHEIALFAWHNSVWEKMESWPIPQTLIHRDP